MIRKSLFLLILIAGLVSIAAAECAPTTIRCGGGGCNHHIALDVNGGPPGCDPWHETDIKPGFNECSDVYITNWGSMSGTLYIIIRDINGDYDLGKYLFFNVENPLIVTNVGLPATVYDFPDEPAADKYIAIQNFIPGQEVKLHWCWEFVETNAPQNEAQGKSLGFTVHYILREPAAPLPCESDEDEDGICNDIDLCDGTTQWSAELLLLPNHYDSSNIDMHLTHGCSCYQILSCKPGNNDGEYRYGCTGGTLNVWREQEADWTTTCTPVAGQNPNDGHFWRLIEWIRGLVPKW
jgi:hypothetical protein